MADDPKHVAKRIHPKNELADGASKMTYSELVQALSDIQDELYLRGMDEPATMVHRALNQITAMAITPNLAKAMATKNKDEST